MFNWSFLWPNFFFNSYLYKSEMQLHMPKHIVGLTLVCDRGFQYFIYRTIWRNSIFFKLSLFHHQKIFTNVMCMYWIIVRQSKVTRVEVLFERCIKYWQRNNWHAEIMFWELGGILSCFAFVLYLSFLYIDMNSKLAID